METIYGYLERITYYNEENHFMVARVQEKGKRDLTTIVGNLAGLCPGVLLKLEGKWGHHKQFGEQFRVERYDIVVPATVKGIEKYLGSGLIRGIGPVMARRIVKVFGLDTLDIIEHHPEQLARVEGVGEKRIEMIKEAWEEQKDVREIMIFLQDCGVSAAYAARIYKQYGRQSVEVVRTNPYRLASEVRGIGFIIADRIAREQGIDPNSVTRAEEGTLYILNQCTGEGHVYYPYTRLVEKAAELLQVEQEVVIRGLDRLLESQRIVMEDLSKYGEVVEGEEKAVYLAPFHHCEVNLARRLLQLREQQEVLPVEDRQPVLARVERQLGVKLAPKQREAVDQSLLNKVLVITGGPGTGKTTIIKAILEMYRYRNLKVLLAAPTGRAAKRMQEATGYEARTLHRLLEYSPRQGGFSRNEDNPLDADVLIVDEASMIDILLMYHLVKAIPPRASLILVGDTNQLPSVGPGHVLKGIIDSGKFKVITLVEIFRQSRWSRIVVNAHRINQGKFPETEPPPAGELSDFYFMEEEDPEEALAKILKLCRQYIPGKFKYHPLREIQVLTPMHRGVIGVANLNVELQKLLNPGGAAINRGGKQFKINDKVMQVVNNYDKEVFNGDIGWITAIYPEDQELWVNFEGRQVNYQFGELDELELAYAVSVHKAQGSEYPAVVMPVMTQHFMLLQRNLLYTGVTRGKKLVVLVGTKKALAIALRNNKPQQRYTLLCHRLSQL